MRRWFAHLPIFRILRMLASAWVEKLISRLDADYSIALS